MSETNIQTLTADDLLNLPSGLGERHELIEGQLLVMAPAGFEHGNVSADFIYVLKGYAKQTGRGRVQSSETGFLTRKDKGTVRAPDASFMSYDRVPADQKPSGYLDIATELVVEVVSPNDSAAEVEAKVQEWLAFGVLMVLVAYPQTHRLYVHRANGTVNVLTADDELDGDEALPGFRVKVRDLFS